MFLLVELANPISITLCLDIERMQSLHLHNLWPSLPPPLSPSASRIQLSFRETMRILLLSIRACAGSHATQEESLAEMQKWKNITFVAVPVCVGFAVYTLSSKPLL